TVRALAGDSTITNLPFRFFLRVFFTFSGFGMPSWASVLPILYMVVPHTGQVPLVPGVAFAVYSGFGSTISRFVLHFTQ
ncbi:MAG: hypothetical protein JJE12_09220, partial [Anaerolineales bacterium]|nr:hypothetical protein [Anaerolineales bacterium]